MKRVSSAAPYLLLSFFFGISFVVVYSSGADSVRYAQELKYLHENQLSIDYYLSGFYVKGDSELDLYQPLLTWLVSRFTGNHQLLFGLFGLVFGHFWFRVIFMARSILPDSLNLFSVLALLFFSLINPIWSINGVRMWTAVGVFFYGLLLIHFAGKKRGYLYLGLPVLIHFSLIISLLLYLFYRLLPVLDFRLLYFIYISTFFVAEIDFDLLREYFDLLPSAFESRRTYLNNDYITGIKEADVEYAIHITLYHFILKYFIVSLVSVMCFSFFSMKDRIAKKLNRFFELTILFSAFSNLLSNIPSGGRFVVLSNLMVGFSLIWFLSIYGKGFMNKTYYYFSLIILIFLIIVQVRIGSDYFGIFLFIGNPMVNLIVQDSTPFINIIKSCF